MRLPRIILNPSIRPWILLWQQERRRVTQLQQELRKWQDKYMERSGSTPIHSTPPRIEPQQQPIIGRSAKRRYLTEHPPENRVKSAEEVLGVVQ